MKHTVHITEQPKKVPSRCLPDGAICGNGDLAITWSGAPERLRFYVSKADFWKAEAGDRGKGGISPIGIIELLTPSVNYSPYNVEQRMEEGEVVGFFSGANTNVEIKTVVLATENTILIEVKATHPVTSHSVSLLSIEGNGAVCENIRKNGVHYLSRSFNDPSLLYPSEAVMEMREVDRKKAGRTLTVRYAVTVTTNHDTAAYKAANNARLLAIDSERLDYLYFSHLEWWKNFWSKSSVTLPDPEIEMHWYAGLYVMACCARNRKFPPGLWGNFITSDVMAWKGDYHLNYNYQAPFYALTSSNHTELMDCYDAPLFDFVPYGVYNAKTYLGCRGIYFPVGIGPLGLNTSLFDGSKEHGELFLGQKIDASFCAIVMALRWYGTRDIEYARNYAYPYMRLLADFWEDYLVYEDGKYALYNDSNHEVDYFEDADFNPTHHDDKNAIRPIIFIKMIMRALLDMQSELGLDADRREKWLDILENTGTLTTFEKDGKTLIRSTEIGKEDCSVVVVDIMIYPTGIIGSRSDPAILSLVRNSFDLFVRWSDDNYFCSYYPTAVRLGIDPDFIFEKIHYVIDNHQLPNYMFTYTGGGTENSAAIPATINEMLMQSYENVIRLFPDWNMKKDASFKNLRAYGAFLVSAELNKGVISASILSEKGRPLTVESPRGGEYVLVKDGVSIPFNGSDVTVETSPNEIVYIKLK